MKYIINILEVDVNIYKDTESNQDINKRSTSKSEIIIYVYVN